ncbi:hypothetical protein R2R35_03950 [Anaerocolumna sp. AGMB13020]|uniref:hypothetical protein n=1 Tax=Anaerocolumna sp. AGMB13020 TaxID=3081750 RepID=UPI00295311D1|nr:hypothetical protein [Anaerocolumna sp. AGMB13020]WOO39256.1 hypothetical protein R2R35_03950 [Anaerocolumna sp. AGMB13020]
MMHYPITGGIILVLSCGLVVFEEMELLDYSTYLMIELLQTVLPLLLEIKGGR